MHPFLVSGASGVGEEAEASEVEAREEIEGVHRPCLLRSFREVSEEDICQGQEKK